MQDIELYTKLLGIRAPWSITGVEVSLKDRSVTVSVCYDESIPVACAVCGVQGSIYDHQKRRWRHLDEILSIVVDEKVERSFAHPFSGGYLDTTRFEIFRCRATTEVDFPPCESFLST
jgi:hypothetical protein